MKLINYFFIVLCTICITVDNSAWADTQSERWYSTFEIGQSKFDYNKNDVNGFVRLDDDATAWGVSAGYHVQPWLAIEAGYFDHGSYSGNGFHCPSPAICVAGIFPVRGELDSLSVNIVPQWRVNEHVSLNGTLGISRWDLSTTLPSPESSGTEFQYGGAARLHLSTRLDLQVGFEISGDRNSYLAGLRWNF